MRFKLLVIAMSFSSIDTLFSEHWCNKLSLLSPHVKNFLSALFFVSRKGHFCLDLQRDRIDLAIATDELQKGADEYFSNHLAVKSNLVTKKQGAYFLMRQLNLEKALVSSFNGLKYKHNTAQFSSSALQGLSDEQKKILLFAQKNSPVFITGGPGSGKTFLAKTLVQAFLESNPNALITICAYTAKAAFLFDSIKSERVEIKTLHSLIKPHKKTRCMIHTDLLIVDECSMISPAFFNLLFESIFKETCSVFMGDPHQLAPVESLSIFDQISCCNREHHFHLSSSFRSNCCIQKLASALLMQNEPVFFNLLETSSNLEFIDIKSIDLVPYLLNSLKRAYPKSSCTSRPDKLLILTPFRHSSKGYLQLNQTLCNQLDVPFTPITIEKNEPALNLCNGQMAVLVGDYAHVYFETHTKKLHKSLLPPFSPSFVTSIHKSQGSSAEHCIIILDRLEPFFNINLLYTAITRARSKVTLISDKNILASVMKESIKIDHRLGSHC